MNKLSCVEGKAINLRNLLLVWTKNHNSTRYGQGFDNVGYNGVTL